MTVDRRWLQQGRRQFNVLEYHRQYWNEELVKYMPYRPGLDVLDLGCGKGLMLEQLLGRTDSAWGIDRVLPPSRESLAPGQVSAAEFERLPFATHAFDTVFGYQILTLSSRVEQILQELSRVLRPSGRLVLWETRRFLRTVIGSDLVRQMQHLSLKPVLREPFDYTAYPLTALIGRLPLLANAHLTQAVAKAAFAVDGLLLRHAALRDKSWYVIIVAEKGDRT